MTGRTRLLTVGHSTASPEDFATLLHQAGVQQLTDIRSYPGSRHCPWFSREEMASWLPDAGISYLHEPRLGGRRHTPAGQASRHPGLDHKAFRDYADWMDGPEFTAGLDAVLAAAQDQVTAVMCSEAVWWRCHRRLVADAAVLLRGAEVLHLFHDGRLAPHPPLDCAHKQGGHLVYS